jgi:hypothetical protein
MSQFAQTKTPSTPAVAATLGRATVTFYVNIYRQSDGNIRPGSKVYRTANNAARKATTPPNLNTYIRTCSFTVDA